MSQLVRNSIRCVASEIWPWNSAAVATQKTARASAGVLTLKPTSNESPQVLSSRMEHIQPREANGNPAASIFLTVAP